MYQCFKFIQPASYLLCADTLVFLKGYFCMLGLGTNLLHQS